MLKFGVSKTGNDQTPPQTTINRHKPPANDDKPPVNNHKSLQTTTNHQQTTANDHKPPANNRKRPNKPILNIIPVLL